VASAFPLTHHYRAVFGSRRTLKIAFDRGTEGVVSSNSGKRGADLTKRWEFGSAGDIRKRSGADSGIEILRRSVFRYETTGISGIAE